MAASPSPTTRILALAVLIMAAGLFSVRAFSVFTKEAPQIQSSNLVEQKVTTLLAPLVGDGNVRLAIRPLQNGQTSFFLMIKETVAFDQVEVETVLQAAAGYKPGTDQLTIMQTPFKTMRAAPSAIDVAELSGLGLLLAFLVFILRPQSVEPKPLRPQPAAQLSKEVLHTQAEPEPDFSEAAKLATSSPQQAANLIRTWIKADRDTVS